MAMKKTKEQKLEVKYNGCLEGAKSIYLHYGIGDNWDNLADLKMRKLKSCYKTEIIVPVSEKVNFCFKDDSENWDNNYGFNYTYDAKNGFECDWVSIVPVEVKKK